MSARLRAFELAMSREGRREPFTFYAATRAAALAIVRAWADSRGWSLAMEIGS